MRGTALGSSQSSSGLRDDNGDAKYKHKNVKGSLNADNNMNTVTPNNDDDDRSSEMEDVHAGRSQALKLLLRRLLMHESGPARAGIPFSVGCQVYTVYATVSGIISDGHGHRKG